MLRSLWRGQGFDPSSTVDITVLDAPGSLNPPVAEVLGFVTDGDGNFHWETGADLMPGYEVTVVGSTKVLELVLLTFRRVRCGYECDFGDGDDGH